MSIDQQGEKRKRGRPKKADKTVHLSIMVPESVVTDIEDTWEKYIQRVIDSGPFGNTYGKMLREYKRQDIIRVYFGLMVHDWNEKLIGSKNGLLIFFMLFRFELFKKILDKQDMTEKEKAKIISDYFASETNLEKEIESAKQFSVNQNTQ